ncbi:MAG: GDP-L-fucose synthase [Dehalococcoidia bacterium]
MDLASKRVMVTGGGGFLGRHLVEAFAREGAQVSAPRSRWADLTDPAEALRAFSELSPQVVVHAAADVGGIGYNQIAPADIFHHNLMMTANVLRAAQQTSVEKLVIIGSACAYPGDVDGLMREEEFLQGPLHPSVECYGFSKRALYFGARAYREQYGMSASLLLLTNLYGPWDKYAPKDSHVVAALVRKFVEGRERGEPSIVCWGTGRPVREFLFVEDCAEAIVRAAKLYDKPEPLNIGTGVGTTIRELAETLHEVTGYRGGLTWDESRPDGAMRKVLDVTRMKAELGWAPRTSLREGLRRTVDWYVSHQAAMAA